MGLHIAGLQQQEAEDGSSDLFSPFPMGKPSQNTLQCLVR